MKTVFCRAPLALLALTLALPAAAAPPAPDRDACAPFPVQQFEPLPGKVVGVLVGDGQDLLDQEGRHVPADTLCLASGAGSYRFPYVPVPKKWIIGGLNVPVGLKGDAVRCFRNLSPASPRTVQRWGVTGPYELVEVEVNGSLGAPPGGTFVATHLKSVEGTREYPLHVGTVVTELRRRFQAYLRDQESTISQGLSHARASLPEGHKLLPGREEAEMLYVTWLPEAKELRVVIRARITQKALATAPPPPRPRVPAGNDGPAPAPPAHAGVQVGVDLGMTYEVSRRGLLDRQDPVPLRPYQKEILVPVTPPRKVAAGK
jgi:hypothetical protein